MVNINTNEIAQVDTDREFIEVPLEPPAESLAPESTSLSPSIFLGIGALMMLGVGVFNLVTGGGSSKKVLASAKWGGHKEKRNARKEAIRQLNSDRIDEMCLWINPPGEINGTDIHKDKKTIWLPFAANGTSVVGGSGSGKSYSVVIPTLTSAIAQGMGTVLLDTDYPGLTRKIAPLARAAGYEVNVFAPGYEESGICNVCDFIDSPRDSTGASQISKTLTKNFQMAGDKADMFWQLSGELATEAALLLAKALPHKDILTAFTILKDEDMIDRVRGVAKIDPWLDLAFGQLLSTAKSERTVDSIRGTAALLFGSLVRPDILPSLIGESTIPTEIRRKQLLVFGVKQDIRLAVSPLIAAIIHAIITKNMIPGRKEPLFLSLDELPSMFFPEIGEWLSEKRKYGLCTQIGFQSLNQLEKTYGKATANVIFTNTATKFMFNPQESDTAEKFSKTLGDVEVKYYTKSYTSGKSRSSTRGEHRVKKRLWSSEDFLGMGRGGCILSNPGYSDGKQYFVPIKLNPIEITDEQLRIQTESEKHWDNLRDELISTGAGKREVSPNEIGTRRSEFHDALPIKNKGTDSTDPPDYSSLLR